MDGKPKLQNGGLDAASRRIRSCRITAVGLSRRISGECPYDQLEHSGGSPEIPSESTSRLRWRAVWKKIVREKKRIFDCSASQSQAAPYDSDSYAQNFDEGSALVEQENLSRSFSSRFAVPAALILQTTGL